MAIGPGVDSAMATMSRMSLSLIQCFFSATSRWISGIMAYPPPKVKAPILKNTRNRDRAVCFDFFTDTAPLFFLLSIQ